jgi:hypothetical protein
MYIRFTLITIIIIKKKKKVKKKVITFVCGPIDQRMRTQKSNLYAAHGLLADK